MLIAQKFYNLNEEIAKDDVYWSGGGGSILQILDITCQINYSKATGDLLSFYAYIWNGYCQKCNLQMPAGIPCSNCHLAGTDVFDWQP